MGAGKSTFTVSKKFPFKQGLLQCATVHGHKAFTFTIAEIMDGSGNEFFARTGFPKNSNVGIRRRGLEDQLIHLLHRRRVAKNAAKSEAFLQRRSQYAVFVIQLICHMLCGQLLFFYFRDVLERGQQCGIPPEYDRTMADLNPNALIRPIEHENIFHFFSMIPFPTAP